MIRIIKSTDVPAILVNDGIPATVENSQLYIANSVAYHNGTTKFVISRSIYANELVKQQLMFDQHDKCCFCEADFTANGYGDVEHFRPKLGFTKTRAGKLIRPGYYWLAYDWDNLFFSCEICNRRHKKNYFPLEDETRRATNHIFDYIEEAPLLLNPSVDNPEDHITFNRHVPVPVAGSIRGKVSITSFGIDRPKLNNLREAHLQNVRINIAFAGVDLETITDAQRQQMSQQMHQPWAVLRDLILKAKEFVAVAADDTQSFAAMVRANFSDLV